MASWKKWLVIYLFSLVCTGAALLMIDSNYFDFPLGKGEAGLPDGQAPSRSFTTAVQFQCGNEFAVHMVLGAKDQSLRVKAELLMPDHSLVFAREFELERSPNLDGWVKWHKLRGPANMPGTFTLRLTQDKPGRITIYFFQGPFVLRLILIPLLVLLPLLLLYWKQRRPKA